MTCQENRFRSQEAAAEGDGLNTMMEEEEKRKRLVNHDVKVP